MALQNVMTSGWFATYGTPVVRGRDFDARDQATATPVVVVNETLVRRFLPSGLPLGRRLRKGAPGRQAHGLRSSAWWQMPRIDPCANRFHPPSTFRSRSKSTQPSYRSACWQSFRHFFGALAVMLAGLGLYGTSWYVVSRRRRELGIRLALGATPAKVRQLVLKRAGVLVSAGVAAGVAGSLWTSSSWLRFCRRGANRANRHHVCRDHSRSSWTAGGLDPGGPSVTNRPGEHASRFVENRRLPTVTIACAWAIENRRLG